MIRDVDKRQAIKCMVGRQEANLLFHNLNDFIPARCMENGVGVLLVDEAHRLELSPNNKMCIRDSHGGRHIVIIWVLHILRLRQEEPVV